ncbi:hypothetical protein O3M35_008133 [Rhynocoris fuscipes]|uniref:Uncharacterized protein n=1 Tax=Rhynocoris fuscipes TaxID=488301 RepID=A0AAW1DCR0_9HEMI
MDTISDWMKERSEVSNKKQPVFSTCFTSNWNNTEVNEIDAYKSLKYFDNEAVLDVNKMNTEFKYFLDEIPVVNYEKFKLFSDLIHFYNFNDKLITSRSVLSRIMNTPFDVNEGRRKWIIKARRLHDNGIHLYYDKDQENISDKMDKQYEMLKRYLFLKYPLDYHRKVTAAFNELFGQLFYLEFDNFELYYTTENPGVISNQELTNCVQVNSAEQVYCDIFEDGEFSDDLINYNPIWWSKAELIKAKQFILASYDKNNDCIKQIYKFNMDKFDDKAKYENLWSPDAAWNFLKDFLQFVKHSMDRVSSDVKEMCIWKFQSFPLNEPLVSCEILINETENGKEKLTPLKLEDLNNFQ